MKVLPEAEKQIAYDSDSFRQKFDVGKTKLHEELNAGRLRARRLGRKLLIKHEDAMAWLAGLPEREPSKQRAA